MFGCSDSCIILIEIYNIYFPIVCPLENSLNVVNDDLTLLWKFYHSRYLLKDRVWFWNGKTVQMKTQSSNFLIDMKMTKNSLMLFWRKFEKTINQVNTKLKVQFQMRKRKDIFVQYNQGVNSVLAVKVRKHLLKMRKRWAME